MGSVPFAFSVHHFINSVGSDAGFASIIGLAVLVLLYFAHARETASLREQIYEWAQRVQQLEARVAQLSRQQPSGPTAAPPLQARTVSGDTRTVPAAAAAAAHPAGGLSHPAAPGSLPQPSPALAGAPAGVAAPALTAATKLIPTADVAAERAGRTPMPTGRLPMPPGELPPDATAVVAPSPQPATVAGGANGSSYDNGPGQPPGAGRPIAPAPPRIQLRQQGTPPPGRRGTVPPRNQPPRPQRGGGRRRPLAIVLVALLAVAIVAGVIVLTSGGGKAKQASTNTGATNASAPRHRTSKSTPPVKPASVTVAVLNGTPTTGLAGRVSQKLTTAGYKRGTVATAADQTRTSTQIAFMPGHRREALAVAKSLNLGPASVQPVDQGTQSVACPPPASCTAEVVATVGTDLANTQ
jgi:hypothetical protein